MTSAERRFIRHLQLVETISTLHRTTPETEDAHAPGMQPTVPDADPQGLQWGHLVLLDRIGEGMSSRGLPCLGFDAASGSRAQAAARRRRPERRARASARRSRAGWRACGTSMSFRSTAPTSTTRASACGWSSCAASRSSRSSRRGGRSANAKRRSIGLDLCAALAAVHGARLLHRDLKAQNVMRESGGRIVLMDFGTGEELAGTNRLVGTPLYLAPEIFSGEKASVQSDLYSLGVLLFYLVTGKFPSTPARWSCSPKPINVASGSRCAICVRIFPNRSCERSSARWMAILRGGTGPQVRWKPRFGRLMRYRPRSRLSRRRQSASGGSARDSPPSRPCSPCWSPA